MHTLASDQMSECLSTPAATGGSDIDHSLNFPRGLVEEKGQGGGFQELCGNGVSFVIYKDDTPGLQPPARKLWGALERGLHGSCAKPHHAPICPRNRGAYLQLHLEK